MQNTAIQKVIVLGDAPYIDSRIDAMLDMLLIAHYADDGIASALQNVGKHLTHPATRLAFDGRVLHVNSASESGRIHMTDGISCQCRGKNHVRCWHRLLHHKLTLHAALVDPVWLVRNEHA